MTADADMFSSFLTLNKFNKLIESFFLLYFFAEFVALVKSWFKQIHVRFKYIKAINQTIENN